MTYTRHTSGERTTRSSQIANEARTFRSGPYLEQLFGGPGATLELKRRQEICRRIQEARVVAGLTQQEMADLLDLSLRGYQTYENERVPFGRLKQIADLTKVEESWLLYGEAVADREDLQAGLATVIELLRSIDEHLVRIGQAMPEPRQSRARASRPR